MAEQRTKPPILTTEAGETVPAPHRRHAQADDFVEYGRRLEQAVAR
jgi:hypothetical protein